MTGTYFPTFDSAGGTAPSLHGQGPPQPEAPPGLSEWLASDIAVQYSGEWVLLGDDWTVIDSDLSPTALTGRNPPREEQLVVYVERTPSIFDR